ncbi:helix-turn-helix transcriptional regulator [Calidifontibacillus oryziterrae]|uniref:helix-turn-helix transcriptional regulator n=1 Tax=Calidifontibacillus oryziterrae TaxID=1191699 RepID=UPI0002D30BE3|nr:metalloregulator ArsR/SmtB family transcription factor [Calidifontibacillus oryziterrae]
MQTKTASTRDEILKMLKYQKRMTVTEMANQLHITEMAVRRHLNTLEKDRYVETILVRQAMGRPLNIYQLTSDGEELFPRNYKNVFLDFMDDIEDIGGKEVVDQLFERRKERIKDKLLQRMENKNFEEKIEELVRIQNENGYMVSVEKEKDGSYEFKEFNCPIAQVADRFEKACSCELELFREVLETATVERHECLGSGDNCCHYHIKKRN